MNGRTALPVLRSAPPLTLRQTGPHTVHLISTAAGPLGGDHFELDLDVAEGTTLEVASVASTLVLPGDGESLMRVTARVADGATLHFLPEPTVLAAGCTHRMEVRLALEGTAQVWWREEIIFGRYGEAPGTCHTRFDATVDGHPLLSQELTTGDPRLNTSPAVYNSATCIGTLLLAGPHPGPAKTHSRSAKTDPESTETHSGPAQPDPGGTHLGSAETNPEATETHTRPAKPGGTHSGPAGTRPYSAETHPRVSHVADGVAVLPLAGPGTLVSALARDAVELRRRLTWGHAALTSPP
ncbi:urease accessory protein UreD [Nonomuraea sp. NPDC050556]|uniref:urease accessory protein UreD n=1 Tax=Nonomuraea sp. NPDC050556 TaxID=3364369 RepID=UPI0037BA6BE9